MIRLTIKKIDGYNYFLEANDSKEYKIDIEFYDIPKLPQVGDFIILSEKILKESNILLNIGSLENICGRTIKSQDDEDIIVLVINDEKYILKRLYG